MISGIVPRPVAFVSTISEDGVENLAPFRYASAIASSIQIADVLVVRVVGSTRCDTPATHDSRFLR